MRKFLKSVTCFAMAAALCVSSAGCYSENNTWAAKKGDFTLPIGSYIYYLSSAYNSAAEQISPDTKILDGTVEDKDAKTWIRDTAMQDVKEYMYLQGEMDDNGLTISETELDNAQSNTDYMWSNYGTYFEPLGVSKDSFHLVYSMYTAKYRAVFNNYYRVGGENEVTDDDLTSYYDDNYFAYEFFSAPIVSYNAETSAYDELDVTEKAGIKSQMESLLDKIEAGDMTLQEASDQYDADNAVEESRYTDSATLISESSSSELYQLILDMDEGEYSFLETSSIYALVHRKPIAEASKKTVEDEASRTDLLLEIKGDEFEEILTANADSVDGVEYNESAMNNVKLSIFATEDNTNGTSSEDSTASDASSPDTSSAEDSSSTESSAE